MAPLQRSKSESQAEQLQIQHFTHHHLLHKLYMTFEFNCDGCNTGGYGVRYRCSACEFDLHEQCATSPHRISSHLHPHHQLMLVNLPGENSRLCQVCKGSINGLSYTCECEFNVHPLCIQLSAATTVVPSLTLDPSQQAGGVSWGHPTTAFGGYNGVSNSQPVMVNHQQQQKQGIHPTTSFGGNNVASHSQPVLINHHHQQQQIPLTTSFGGNNVVSNSQPVMINHHQQQQQQQAIPATSFGGYHGLPNSQPVMVNHHQKQTQTMNYQQQQPQGIPTTAFGGYNSQVVPVNYQQQQQVIPTTALNGYHGMNTNQQVMNNHKQHYQQQHQQQQPATNSHGYTIQNNNQTVIINQHQQQPQLQMQPLRSNNYSNVGKIAANILSTSLIGFPVFNSRN